MFLKSCKKNQVISQNIRIFIGRITKFILSLKFNLLCDERFQIYTIQPIKTKSKTMKQFTFIIIASLMLFSCKKNDDFVLLKKIVADEGQYIEREEYFDKDEVIKLSSVLIYYGESIKVVNDSIFISKKSYSDKNYLWNIQNKSNDSVWYSTHILNPEVEVFDTK